MKIAVVGAGLSGLSAAHFLQKTGAGVTIFERENRVATGASGNDIGMVNPRISAEYSPLAVFYIQAFHEAIALYETMPTCNWTQCGALHLMTDEKRETRYRKTVQNWQKYIDTMQIVSKKRASELSNISMNYDALLIKNSGYVSPIKLCNALSENVTIQYDTPFDISQHNQYDAVILCCAVQTKDYIALPLNPVRGQITTIETTPELENLSYNIHYGGYISANHNGTHAVGATFQRWLDHTDIIPEDDDYNLNTLQTALPFITEKPKVIDHRASIRTTTPDHAPVIGHVRDNIYVSTAHGSHGLVTAIGAAHLLTNMITKNSVHYTQETLNTLSPLRFSSGSI